MKQLSLTTFHRQHFHIAVTRLLLLIFAFTNIAFAHKPETSIWDARRKPVQAVVTLPTFKPSLNSSVRQIFETLPGGFLANVNIRQSFKGNANQPKIILIEDIHQNGEAQKHISNAIQSFENGALVGLEGAYGPFLYDLYKTLPHKDIAKQVADSFFERGEISGSAHAGLTSYPKAGTNPLTFWGVDDPKEYLANVAAYRNSRKNHEAMRTQLGTEKESLKSEKENTFGAELKNFDTAVEAYRDGTLSLGAYLRLLADINNDVPVSIANFLQAYEMEKTMDFARVESDRSRILEKMVKKMSETEIQVLTQISLGYKQNVVTFAQYYSHFRDISKKHQIDLSQFPHFDNYVRYVFLTDGVNAEKLEADVAAHETHISERLAKTEEQKNLLRKSRQLYLLGRLVDFSLTPREWKEYTTLINSPWTIDHGPNLSSFEDFYRAAEQRNVHMVHNLLTRNQVPGTRNSSPILLSGGFHTRGITEILRAKGISYIVATPKLSKVDAASGSAYLSVFDQEKGLLEKMFSGKKLFLAAPVALAEKQILELNDVGTQIGETYLEQARSRGAISTSAKRTLEKMGVTSFLRSLISKASAVLNSISLKHDKLWDAKNNRLNVNELQNILNSAAKEADAAEGTKDTFKIKIIGSAWYLSDPNGWVDIDEISDLDISIYREFLGANDFSSALSSSNNGIAAVDRHLRSIGFEFSGPSKRLATAIKRRRFPQKFDLKIDGEIFPKQIEVQFIPTNIPIEHQIAISQVLAWRDSHSDNPREAKPEQRTRQLTTGFQDLFKDKNPEDVTSDDLQQLLEPLLAALSQLHIPDRGFGWFSEGDYEKIIGNPESQKLIIHLAEKRKTKEIPFVGRDIELPRIPWLNITLFCLVIHQASDPLSGAIFVSAAALFGDFFNDRAAADPNGEIVLRDQQDYRKQTVSTHASIFQSFLDNAGSSLAALRGLNQNQISAGELFKSRKVSNIGVEATPGGSRLSKHTLVTELRRQGVDIDGISPIADKRIDPIEYIQGSVQDMKNIIGDNERDAVVIIGLFDPDYFAENANIHAIRAPSNQDPKQHEKEQYDQIASELHRILKAGGELYLMAIYDNKALLSALRAAGFEEAPLEISAQNNDDPHLFINRKAEPGLSKPTPKTFEELDEMLKIAFTTSAVLLLLSFFPNLLLHFTNFHMPLMGVLGMVVSFNTTVRLSRESMFSHVAEQEESSAVKQSAGEILGSLFRKIFTHNDLDPKVSDKDFSRAVTRGISEAVGFEKAIQFFQAAAEDAPGYADLIETITDADKRNDHAVTILKTSNNPILRQGAFNYLMAKVTENGDGERKDRDLWEAILYAASDPSSDIRKNLKYVAMQLVSTEFLNEMMKALELPTVPEVKDFRIGERYNREIAIEKARMALLFCLEGLLRWNNGTEEFLTKRIKKDLKEWPQREATLINLFKEHKLDPLSLPVPLSLLDLLILTAWWRQHAYDVQRNPQKFGSPKVGGVPPYLRYTTTRFMQDIPFEILKRAASKEVKNKWPISGFLTAWNRFPSALLSTLIFFGATLSEASPVKSIPLNVPASASKAGELIRMAPRGPLGLAEYGRRMNVNEVGVAVGEMALDKTARDNVVAMAVTKDSFERALSEIKSLQNNGSNVPMTYILGTIDLTPEQTDKLSKVDPNGKVALVPLTSDMLEGTAYSLDILLESARKNHPLISEPITRLLNGNGTDVNLIVILHDVRLTASNSLAQLMTLILEDAETYQFVSPENTLKLMRLYGQMA